MQRRALTQPTAIAELKLLCLTLMKWRERRGERWENKRERGEVGEQEGEVGEEEQEKG